MSTRFRPTEHLASEAIAAYVDGELRMNPYLRAAAHLAACPECSAEVEAQQQARGALRDSGEIAIPHTLLGTLSQIPLSDGRNGLNSPAAGRYGAGAEYESSLAGKRWALPWSAGWRRK